MVGHINTRDFQARHPRHNCADCWTVERVSRILDKMIDIRHNTVTRTKGENSRQRNKGYITYKGIKAIAVSTL